MGRKQMFGPNTDLLLATNRYHADGRPRDPHAHHRHAHVMARRARRRAWWAERLRAFGQGLRRLALARTAPAAGTVDCTSALR